MVKFSVYSIRKRTREGLGKDREVTHAVVRWREQNMHGRISVPVVGDACFLKEPANPTAHISTRSPWVEVNQIEAKRQMAR